MIISRQFAGIILMAIVFSTVLTFLMIDEKPESLVEIIKNDAPSLNSGSDQKYGYAFTIVLRKDFAEVKVKFAWLRNMPKLLNGSPIGSSVEEILPFFMKIETLEELLGRWGWEPEMIDRTLWREGWPSGDDLLLLDYSEGLSPGMNDMSPFVHPIYLFALADGQVDYYEGVADFFPEAEWRFPDSLNTKPVRNPRSSGSLEFGLDENRTRYVSEGEKRLYPELPTLEDLPPYGELVFKDVKKDQRLTILTFFYGRSLGYGWQRELIRVYLDGELELIQVN